MFLPTRTRMTGILLNTLMGDTLMGDIDDDLIDEISSESDTDYFSGSATKPVDSAGSS